MLVSVYTTLRHSENDDDDLTCDRRMQQQRTYNDSFDDRGSRSWNWLCERE